MQHCHFLRKLPSSLHYAWSIIVILCMCTTNNKTLYNTYWVLVYNVMSMNLFNPAEWSALCISFFSESLSMKSGYLSIQNYGSFWRQLPSHIMYLVFVIDKNVFHPSDKSALCAAFFRNFVSDNLDISPSRTMVLLCKWFHLICI